ncbi:MAG: hypothetical protein LBP36_02595 [Oscillospiraceae bacterium]|jgi:hypothetical protein|nr:hypothetical protein [Oscillospiraceae bacterium]
MYFIFKKISFFVFGLFFSLICFSANTPTASALGTSDAVRVLFLDLGSFDHKSGYGMKF